MLVIDSTKPTWGASLDPEGPIGRTCGASWALNEGGGPIVADGLYGRYNGTLAGSPVWSPGPSAFAGVGLSGYSTVNFVQVDPTTQLVGVVYPWWLGVLFAWTAGNTGNGFLISQASSSSANGQIGINVNVPTTANARYFLIDDAGTAASVTSSGLALNDGGVHLVMAYSLAPNKHFLSVDGSSTFSGTTTVGTFTDNRLTLGLQRSNTTGAATKGTIYWAGGGQGAAPDPAALAAHLWSVYAPSAIQRSIFLSPAGPGASRPPRWPQVVMPSWSPAYFD